MHAKSKKRNHLDKNIMYKSKIYASSQKNITSHRTLGIYNKSTGEPTVHTIGEGDEHDVQV